MLSGYKSQLVRLICHSWYALVSGTVNNCRWSFFFFFCFVVIHWRLATIVSARLLGDKQSGCIVWAGKKRNEKISRFMGTIFIAIMQINANFHNSFFMFIFLVSFTYEAIGRKAQHSLKILSFMRNENVSLSIEHHFYQWDVKECMFSDTVFVHNEHDQIVIGGTFFNPCHLLILRMQKTHDSYISLIVVVNQIMKWYHWL